MNLLEEEKADAMKQRDMKKQKGQRKHELQVQHGMCVLGVLFWRLRSAKLQRSFTHFVHVFAGMYVPTDVRVTASHNPSYTGVRFVTQLVMMNGVRIATDPISNK